MFLLSWSTCNATDIQIGLYLVTLSDSREILARIAFPFPHGIRTGDAFVHLEYYNHVRIPSGMESEVR